MIGMIGNVDKYIIKTLNQQSETTETTLAAKFKFNPEATYENVDIASRAIAALSTDVYSDTSLITDISVNDNIVDYIMPKKFKWDIDTTNNRLTCNLSLEDTNYYFIAAALFFHMFSNTGNVSFGSPILWFNSRTFAKSEKIFVSCVPSSGNVSSLPSSYLVLSSIYVIYGTVKSFKCQEISIDSRD